MWQNLTIPSQGSSEVRIVSERSCFLRSSDFVSVKFNLMKFDKVILNFVKSIIESEKQAIFNVIFCYWLSF